jgi:hypothetical protein
MDQPVSFDAAPQSAEARSAPEVVHFRQILLWPLHLTQTANCATQDHAESFARLAPGNPWFEVADEFTGDPADFQERHYNEFVTFLPPVQRFLYGQGSKSAGNPIKVMRRSDIAQVSVTLAPGAAPLQLNVSHIDLYFFFDIDVAILAFELFADAIPLATAQDIMFRLGRAYPAYWEKDGAPGHCPQRVEWLSAMGEVLAASDFEQRSKYLANSMRTSARRSRR